MEKVQDELNLNIVKNMNASGKANYDTIVPTDKKGEYLKGGLSPFILRGDVYKANEKMVNSDALDDDLKAGELWFWLQYQNLLSASIELWDWENLPEELDKYLLESKLKYNGIVGIIKIDNTFYAVSTTTIESKFDYGALPKYVSISKQDPLYKIFKNRKLKVNKQIFLIRNNLQMTNAYLLIKRFLINLEKILYYFEKNNAVSLPRALILNQLESSELIKESWDSFVKSTDTFNSYMVDNELLNSLRQNGMKSPYIPVEFEDKTRQLIENFNVMKEQIKEILGFDTLQLNGKKEKVLSQEMEASNSLASYYREHNMNIRKNDLKIINKTFNLNINIVENKIKQELKQIEDGQQNNEI